MTEELKLDDQLCFSIYVLHREIMQQYRPILEALDLTYPQYITMIALWEKSPLTVNALAEKLQLDNGTLTPLLKRLETKGVLTRTRSKTDERVVNINLTEKGQLLKKKALCVPKKIMQSIPIQAEEITQFKDTADKVIDTLHKLNKR